MNCSSLYTQKDLTQKVKPRHTGGYRLDLQVNNVRKTFYSSKIGDAGRRECAKKSSRVDWWKFHEEKLHHHNG